MKKKAKLSLNYHQISTNTHLSSSAEDADKNANCEDPDTVCIDLSVENFGKKIIQNFKIPKYWDNCKL